jgi:catalase (peroxidase I)
VEDKIYVVSAEEEMLIDKAQLLNLAPEMTVLVGGSRVSKHELSISLKVEYLQNVQEH